MPTMLALKLDSENSRVTPLHSTSSRSAAFLTLTVLPDIAANNLAIDTGHTPYSATSSRDWPYQGESVGDNRRSSLTSNAWRDAA